MSKTETKSTVLVKHHLKQLKLPTMQSECEKTAARAAKENLDHLAYLLALCEAELVDRERRAAERRLKAARFPATKTLQEFEFDLQPSVNKPLVLELAKGDWIDQRENLLLVGASGTGKTHLATALALAACLQGRKVRFFRVTELIALMLEARDDKQLLKFRSQLAKLDLVVLDELGYVPASRAGAELLFDVIGTAYERQSLVVTTNLSFEHWTEVLGSERLNGAALDRLTHRCHMAFLLKEREVRRHFRRRYQPLGEGHTIWLFAGNDAAAENHSRLWSLIASAERHAVDPQQYLTSVLAKVGQTPMKELEQFLPDVWKQENAAESAAPVDA